MLKPLTQFICDSCNEIIEKPEHGWIEWLVTGARIEDWECHSFRIVHHKSRSPYPGWNGCYNYTPATYGKADMHLNHLTEQQEMLIELVSIIGTTCKPTFQDIKVAHKGEYLQFVRRLTLPYYEEARLYLNKAIANGYFEEERMAGPYHPNTLKELVKMYTEF